MEANSLKTLTIKNNKVAISQKPIKKTLYFGGKAQEIEAFKYMEFNFVSQIKPSLATLLQHYAIEFVNSEKVKSYIKNIKIDGIEETIEKFSMEFIDDDKKTEKFKNLIHNFDTCEHFVNVIKLKGNEYCSLYIGEYQVANIIIGSSHDIKTVSTDSDLRECHLRISLKQPNGKRFFIPRDFYLSYNDFFPILKEVTKTCLKLYQPLYKFSDMKLLRWINMEVKQTVLDDLVVIKKSGVRHASVKKSGIEIGKLHVKTPTSGLSVSAFDTKQMTKYQSDGLSEKIFHELFSQ